jgi:hypothetical protein
MATEGIIGGVTGIIAGLIVLSIFWLIIIYGDKK